MFTFRRAGASDLPTVHALLNERLRWLRHHNIEQWILDPNRSTEEWTAKGYTWLLEDGTEPVGTLAMSTLADDVFWSAAEQRMPAFYLAKLATLPARAGEGLGELLNQCALLYAAEHHIPRTRWDVWRSNEGLQRYYRSIGADYLRTVASPDQPSGALFEFAFIAPTPKLPVTISYATETIATLDTEVFTPPSGLDRHSHDRLQPEARRWLDVPGLELCDEARPLRVLGNTSSVGVLFNSGHGWYRHTNQATQPVRGSALDNLQPGLAYLLQVEQDQVLITGDTLSNGVPSWEASNGTGALSR